MVEMGREGRDVQDGEVAAVGYEEAEEGAELGGGEGLKKGNGGGET